MNKLFLLFGLASFILCYCNPSKMQNSGPAFTADSIRIIKNELNYPWEILWGKDDHIWMTERGGKISKLDPVSGNIVFTASIPEVVSNNEGGLLGMVQDPGFLTNGFFYVVYDYMNAGSYREKMVKMRFSNGAIEPVLTLIQDIPASPIHNGSRLWITSDAAPKIFMTTGDASVSVNAQNTASLSGKVLRFNLDGSIPADNPYPGSPVWSFGHRNQQGLVVYNGIMYASEHGPNIEDELNIIEKNRNYGWPTVNGPCDEPGEVSFCATNNVKTPIWSSGSSTIAVCGLDHYHHDRIPEWKNSLLMLTLKDASLRVLTLSADGLSVTGEKTFYKSRFGRLRDICISPEGRVYLCTSNGGASDMLIEISKL